MFEDARGRLTLIPWDEVPFTPVRGYVLSEIPLGACRGGHALRSQHRFLICLSGTAEVILDDGAQADQRTLAAPETLLVAPGTWLQLRALDERLSVLVLADGPYEPAEYVRERSGLPIASPRA